MSRAQRPQYQQVPGEETLGESQAAYEDLLDVPRGKSSYLGSSLSNRSVLCKFLIALFCLAGILCIITHLVFTIHGPSDSLLRRILSPVPPLGLRKVTFNRDTIYSRRPNAESDQAWDNLLPPGRGFVFIPDREEYNLPEGQDTPWGMIYSVSVFHQLHCLGQLRRLTWIFLDAIAQNNANAMEEIKAMASSEMSSGHIEHMNHCFDYLRQSIMCAGDMAIEWPREEPSDEKIAVDGWGIPHECKDWDGIMEYVDANHFNMSTNDQIAPLAGPIHRA